MNRSVILLLATCMLPAAIAQTLSTRTVDMHNDGHCNEVHPGDTVNYVLTVENVSESRAVFADLQMRPVRDVPFRASGLPSPDFRNLGGGGSTKPNPSEPKIFRFSFVVPQEIYGGRYRGAEVVVDADEPELSTRQKHYVGVSRRTRKHVRSFCLNVVSNYGKPEERPEVTNFQPGVIVPKE